MKSTFEQDAPDDLAKHVVHSSVRATAQAGRNTIWTISVDGGRWHEMEIHTNGSHNHRTGRQEPPGMNLQEALHDFLLPARESEPGDRSPQSFTTLRAAYASTNTIPPQLWAALGHFLGTLQQTPGQVISSNGHSTTENGRLPWILANICPAAALFETLSQAEVELFRLMQTTWQIKACLTRLARGWEASGWSHGDLKWDNILVTVEPAGIITPQITVIDWETAGPGDPGWDLGSIFGEFLSFWSLSIPAVPGESPESSAMHARYPLDAMRPAVHEFWNSYVATLGLDEESARGLLNRALRFAGAHLIQTAFERSQISSHLSSQLYILVQLGLNIMERPEEAAEGLFGLSLPHASR